MDEKINVKQVVSYGGHSISSKGIINLTLKSNYSELIHTISLTQMLNNDITVKARTPDAKPMKIGLFRIKQIIIDGDGESTLKFNSTNDFVELDNLNTLPTIDFEVPEFVVMYETIIEQEGGNESDE